MFLLYIIDSVLPTQFYVIICLLSFGYELGGIDRILKARIAKPLIGLALLRIYA